MKLFNVDYQFQRSLRKTGGGESSPHLEILLISTCSCIEKVPLRAGNNVCSALDRALASHQTLKDALEVSPSP